jgi:hypothetical protein
MRAVDEQELDRLLEPVGGRLRQRRDRSHELCDARAVDVRLEVAEPVIGVRVDCIDRYASAVLGADAEADGRLPLPGADLHDHSFAPARASELIQRLALLVGEPARNVRDERLDLRLEVAHFRAPRTASS